MVVHCIFVHHPSLDSILETLSSPVLSRRQEGEEENVSVGSSVEGSKGSLGGHLWGATFDGEDEEYLRESRCFQDSSDEFSENETPLLRPPLSEYDFYSQPSTSDVANRFYKEAGYVTKVEAKEALVYLVGSKFCYGSSAAQDLDIYESTTHNSLMYTLETFTESRSVFWDKLPHSGEMQENLPGGSVLEPWHIHCHPTRMFHDETKQLEMPHTAFIADCQSCSSSGWGKCRSCVSRGHIRCVNCSGTGRLSRMDNDHRYPQTCWHCHGTGRKKCSTCGGKGKIFCSVCQGHKQVKFISKLRVEYKNLRSDHAILPNNIPENLIMEAPGDFIIDEVQPRVKPIVDYNQDELCVKSQTFFQQHIIESRNSKIIMQRQRLKLVPLLECNYSWLEMCGRFWIYGKNKQVYAPDYPQRQCWGCIVM